MTNANADNASRQTANDAATTAHSAYPTAHPITAASAVGVTSGASSSGTPNDGAPRGTTPRPKARLLPRDVSELAAWLSDRDRAVLQAVSDHQFLTVRQIEALLFAGHSSTSGARIARRTMARLRRYRILGTLQRRIGGVRAGSAGLIHYVDGVGDQLLRGRSGRLARNRSVEPSSRFVAHRLAVADTHIVLVTAARQQAIDVVSCAVEPEAWRRYVGAGGVQLTVKADLYAETAVPPDGDLVHGWFLEVDLGHEAIPTLLKKCRDYEAYRRSGVEQERSGSFPVVIWSMTHTDPDKAHRRRLALRAAIDADRALPPQLFRITDPQQLIAILRSGGQQ